MLYICLLYESEEAGAIRNGEESDEMIEEFLELEKEMKKRNAYILGKPLMSTDTATTVRIANGKTVFTDGPFAETKEQLIGFYLLDCQNLDEALELAEKIPVARRGCVEVRPIYVMDPKLQERFNNV